MITRANVCHSQKVSFKPIPLKIKDVYVSSFRLMICVIQSTRMFNSSHVDPIDTNLSLVSSRFDHYTKLHSSENLFRRSHYINVILVLSYVFNILISLGVRSLLYGKYHFVLVDISLLTLLKQSTLVIVFDTPWS